MEGEPERGRRREGRQVAGGKTGNKGVVGKRGMQREGKNGKGGR